MTDAGRGEQRSAALAEYYDLDLSPDQGDIELYQALAAAHGERVLELCIGTGRIALPLALAGNHVTGVDLDPAMLQRAAARWSAAGATDGSLELVAADATSVELHQAFDLVFVALNSFVQLEGREAQRGLLHTMRSHLAPDGRAVIDVWLPTPEDLALYDGRLVLEWLRRDAKGAWVSKTTTAEYDYATQTAVVITLFDTWRDGSSPIRHVRQDAITFVGANELTMLVEAAGLQIETLAGDYSLEPFGGDSERLIVVCRSAD